MKAKITPLKFHKFLVEEALFKTVIPNKSKVQSNDSTPEYTVDIDFNHYINPQLIKVDMVVGVNTKGKQAGISVKIKAIGIFSLKTEGLNENQIFNLKVVSTTSIMINNIRNYISQLTSYSPFGMYMLPTIDITHLIEEKRKAND